MIIARNNTAKRNQHALTNSKVSSMNVFVHEISRISQRMHMQYACIDCSFYSYCTKCSSWSEYYGQCPLHIEPSIVSKYYRFIKTLEMYLHRSRFSVANILMTWKICEILVMWRDRQRLPIFFLKAQLNCMPKKTFPTN